MLTHLYRWKTGLSKVTACLKGVQVWWCLNPRRAWLPNSWLGGYSCDCIQREDRERADGRMRGRKRGRERRGAVGPEEEVCVCVVLLALVPHNEIRFRRLWIGLSVILICHCLPLFPCCTYVISHHSSDSDNIFENLWISPLRRNTWAIEYTTITCQNKIIHWKLIVFSLVLCSWWSWAGLSRELREVTKLHLLIRILNV